MPLLVAGGFEITARRCEHDGSYSNTAANERRGYGKSKNKKKKRRRRKRNSSLSTHPAEPHSFSYFSRLDVKGMNRFPTFIEERGGAKPAG